MFGLVNLNLNILKALAYEIVPPNREGSILLQQNAKVIIVKPFGPTVRRNLQGHITWLTKFAALRQIVQSLNDL